MKDKRLNLAHYYINEYINEKELVWQLKEIKDKGFNGLILSPAKGLAIGFMSPEWISIINFILLISDEIDLVVYLSTDAVNPTNILETKYLFEEIDYKLFYLSLQDKVDIKNIENLEVEKGDLLYAMKRDSLGNLESNSAICVQLGSPDIKKLKNRDVSIVKFSKVNAERTSNDLYPFNFLIKNTTQELVEKVYKRSFNIFNKYSSFVGFYEPRLFPKIKSGNGIIWNDLLIDDFMKELDLDIRNIIPELFFSDMKKYQTIRGKYEQFILKKYKNNFIDIVEKFISDKKIKIIYQFDSLAEKKNFHHYFEFTPLYSLDKYIGENSRIAYYLPYLGNYDIDITAAIFFQSLQSLNIIKNSIAIITDKHHRFNFTPYRYLNLKKSTILFNTTDTITESFLYSIKCFRKNDIVPNIFYQNRFWKYMKKGNQQIDKLLDDTIECIEGFQPDYDLIIVYSNVERYNMYSFDEYEHEFYDNFMDTLRNSKKTIFIIPSEKLSKVKIRKTDGELFFVYSENNINISANKMLMIYGDKDNVINKWYDKNSTKIDVLKVGVKKTKEDMKLNIFDKDFISKYLDKLIKNDYKIETSFDTNIYIQKIFKKKEKKYLVFNQNNKELFLKFLDQNEDSYEHSIDKCEFKIIDKKNVEFSVLENEVSPNYKIILKNNWQFNSNFSNILPLTQWLFKVGGPKDESIGTVHYFETQFISNIIPNKLSLILDGVYGEMDSINIKKPVKIMVNNSEVDSNFQKLESAHTLFKVDITNFVIKGDNKIVIKSKGAHFSPITLNEPQFLEGDFVIKKKLNDMWVIDKPEKPLFDGNWVENGYPYYAGTGDFSQFFMIEKNFSKVLLNIDKYNYPIEIFINDKFVASMTSPPYLIDITEFVSEGKNKLLVSISSSVVNIFTGIKLPEGMTGEVSLEVYKQ